MAKPMYVKPAGESSLTGAKGLKHNEPVPEAAAKEAANHMYNTKRKHSDEDGWENEPQTKYKHQEVSPTSGKRD